MNRKITLSLLIGMFLIGGLVIALPQLPPPNIPPVFQLQIPPLPTATGLEQIRGTCAYTQITQVREIKVWNNYNDGLNFRLEYSFVLDEPQCSIGFFGNVSYDIFQTPIQAIQNDFNNQILGSIAQPPPNPSPIATGSGSGGIVVP